ncbi:MAG: Str [Circular genetic element sp.]|nr:MAG: Str [Circular genetic element sp.]
MPYRRKGKKKTSNLKRWKKRLSKPRGGYNTRQTIQNARAIKQLKKRPELKFQNSVIASTANNFCGQLMRPTPVSNWGLPQSTNDWVASGGSSTNLSAEKYCPVIIRPVCCG